MGNFINLSTNSDKSHFLDADSISLIFEYKEKAGQNKKPDEVLSFYDETQGKVLSANKKGWGLDSDQIINELNIAGTEMVAIPYVWDGREPNGAYYINPKSFLTIMTSEVKEPEDGSEPYASVLIDVKGYGRVESHAVPVSVIGEFMDVVLKHKPDVQRVEADVARARFIRPGFSAYDPNEITRIYSDSVNVNVHFDTLRIDYNFMHDGGRVVNDYLNRLFKRVAKGRSLEDLKNAGIDLDELGRRASLYDKRKEKRIRDDFAASIAKTAPSLIKVENSREAFYTCTDIINRVFQHDDNNLTIYYNKKAQQQYPEEGRVAVDCKEDVSKAAKVLLGIKQP